MAAPPGSRYSALFSPLRIGAIEVRNRVLVTAHQTNFSDKYGHASDAHRGYHAERAAGGVGLIVSEGLAVHPTAQSQVLHARLDRDDLIEPWVPVVAGVHDRGARMIAQLNHAGRSASSMLTHQAVWSSTAIMPGRGDAIAHVMDAREISEMVAAYAAAAARAVRAGFDGVEVHLGHGHLLNQFLSPVLNARSDEYGGTLENRLRLPIQVLEQVRAAVPDAVFGIRVSADEFVPDGITLESCAEIVHRIVGLHLIDYISVSQSGYHSPQMLIPDMQFPPGSFRHLAAGIRREVADGLPVFSVGRVTTPALAEDLLRAGDADMVAMTRAHIADPYLLAKAATGREHEIRTCIACNQGCAGALLGGSAITCLQNPAVGREITIGGEFPAPAPLARSVLVVGGGPGGLEAAWVAAARGHSVTLLESGPALGGAVLGYDGLESRSQFGGVIRFREEMLRKFGVTVVLNQAFDAQSAAEHAPDVVILATGSVSFVPPALARAGRTCTAEDALAGAVDGAERVVVYDVEMHAQGITVAELLAGGGCSVTLVTPSETVAPGVVMFSRTPALARLRSAGVALRPGHTWTGWADDQPVFTAPGAEPATVAADRVVVVGFRTANDSARAVAEAAGLPCVVIGDAFAPRQALDAIHDGYEAAYRIGSAGENAAF